MLWLVKLQASVQNVTARPGQEKRLGGWKGVPKQKFLGTHGRTPQQEKFVGMNGRTPQSKRVCCAEVHELWVFLFYFIVRSHGKTVFLSFFFLRSRIIKLRSFFFFVSSTGLFLVYFGFFFFLLCCANPSLDSCRALMSSMFFFFLSQRPRSHPAPLPLLLFLLPLPLPRKAGSRAPPARASLAVCCVSPAGCRPCSRAG